MVDDGYVCIISDLALKITRDCTAPTAIEFRSKLGFKQGHIILCKEAVLKTVMDTFEGEEMITQYSVFVPALNKTCKIDLYFRRYRLALEVDEKGHKDRPIDYEIKRQQTIKEKLGCTFIRINPDEENFKIDKIHRHIIESTKKNS